MLLCQSISARIANGVAINHNYVASIPISLICGSVAIPVKKSQAGNVPSVALSATKKKQNNIDKLYSMSILSPVLETILQLKKTSTPQFPTGMTWREIGKRLGTSGQAAHERAMTAIKGEKVPRCPCCLQKLAKATKESEVPQTTVHSEP